MLGHLVSNVLHDGPSRQTWSLAAFVRRLLALFKP